MAVDKGCDGVEPDNVDGYANKSGFKITYADQLKYNIWLAQQAHDKGLAVGLKNASPMVNDLVSYFDFAVVEQCFQYNECNAYKPFISANKAVFEVEYSLKPAKFCKQANDLGFSSLKMPLDLDGSARYSCQTDFK